MAQSPEALSAERTDSSERSATGAGWGTAAWGEVLMTTRSILRRGPLTMLSTMPATGVTRHMAVSFLSCIRGLPRLTSSPSLTSSLGRKPGKSSGTMAILSGMIVSETAVSPSEPSRRMLSPFLRLIVLLIYLNNKKILYRQMLSDVSSSYNIAGLGHIAVNLPNKTWTNFT